MQLFEHDIQMDSSAKHHLESEYEFLNRSSWNVSIRSRDLCQAMFEDYPSTDHHRDDLHGRFTSDDEGQHLGAYFELVVHELLRRLGFAVTVHPRVPGVNSQPDFLARSGDNRFYLEATVSQASSAEIPDNAILDQIYTWIDEIDDPHFLVTVRPSGCPTNQPSKRYIQSRIRRLMADSDPDRVLQQVDGSYSRRVDAPSVTIELDGCSLHVGLWPKPREKWGISAGRTIAAWFGGGAKDVSPTLGAAVDRKAREKRVGQLDAPLVVACSTVDGFYNFAEEGLVSLFGLRNREYGPPDWNVKLGEPRLERGVWIDKSGVARNENLAAVWLFGNARPVATTPTGYGDRLFLNPHYKQNLPKELLSVASAHVHDGQLLWTEGVDLSALLDIPEIPYAELRKAPIA